MPNLTWLADVLRSAGLPVREVPGWQTRGHGAMNSPRGVLCHHTAGPASGDFPSENVVVHGRTGLPGPLCNLGLTRSGTWVVVAAGSAWHAGTGSSPWVPANQGNTHLVGVEAESAGTRDDWTAAQRASYPRGVAALLKHLQLPASRAIGHKEWAPSRKIDPAFWDMNSFRADVARWMNSLMEDDLSAQAEQNIALLVQQLITGPNNEAWGWPTFGGGTAETLTVVDYLRRANVQLENVKTRLAAIETGKAPTGPPVLSDADVQRIAAAVVKLLGQKAAA